MELAPIVGAFFVTESNFIRKSNPKARFHRIIETIEDMKYLTLNDIKAHCRIDIDAEDSLLELYGEAAEDTVLNYIGKTYDELIEEYTTLPKPIVQATLMLVDTSYQYRSPISAQSMSIVPYTFDLLVKPYVKL